MQDTLLLLRQQCCSCAVIPESQSNHSSQSDSGVSELTSAGHTRSQSVVSSIFSDAWRRGTQGEVQAHVHTLSLLFFCLPSNIFFHQSPSASLPAFKGEGTFAGSSLFKRRRRRKWRLGRQWCYRPSNSVAAPFKMLNWMECPGTVLLTYFHGSFVFLFASM